MKAEFRELLVKRGRGLQSQKKISDVWFQNLWIESGMHIPEGPYRDRFNEPFTYYIPDCVNFAYRYVIEVDDPTHDLADQKRRDARKDAFYKKNGYRIFRLKSHDYDGFVHLKQEIRNLRESKGCLCQL